MPIKLVSHVCRPKCQLRGISAPKAIAPFVRFDESAFTFFAFDGVAVDELSGLIMAMGYLRPNNLEDLQPKSVKKKLKDKAFARGVSRDDVRLGIEELGIEQDTHILIVVGAMQGIAGELGF